jgi:hypothetical protein
LAAASLKQRKLFLEQVVLVTFRGHLAAASLKREHQQRARVAAKRFPRPFGRGLIEAGAIENT